ncbi:hypothetical protein GOC13_24560 [Sinorhizobium meliloti]|nr:hypothetical protein [Sinorhizobium meliloti]
MAKFTAGQTVVAVKDFNSSYYGRIITTGKRYEITSIGQTSGRVGVKDDRGSKRFFSPEHFMDAAAYDFQKAQEQINRFEPGVIEPWLWPHMVVTATKKPKKPKTPRSIKIDPADAKAALTKMLKEVYGIDATVEHVIGAMDKSLELVLSK